MWWIKMNIKVAKMCATCLHVAIVSCAEWRWPWMTLNRHWSIQILCSSSVLSLWSHSLATLGYPSPYILSLFSYLSLNHHIYIGDTNPVSLFPPNAGFSAILLTWCCHVSHQLIDVGQWQTIYICCLLITRRKLLNDFVFIMHYCAERRRSDHRPSFQHISPPFTQSSCALRIQLWLVAYFSGHSHCTSYRGHISAIENITASIVQGSAIGPVSYTLSMPLTFYPSHLVTSFASTLTTRVSLYRRTMSTPEWLK